MISTNERIGDPTSERDAHFTGRQAMIWTALPGIIQKFDPVELTCEVQPAIQGKRVLEDGGVEVVNLPLLLDCPVVFPHAGGCSMTFPIKTGDECLVVFACRAIDVWWQSGGIQPPAETRMHDLSDGFVIPGPWSQAKRISGVSTSRLEIRSDDHQALVSIHPQSHDVTVETTGKLTGTIGGAATLKCPTLKIDCPSTTITGDVKIEKNLTVVGAITGTGGLTVSGGSGATVSGDVVADGISLKSHTHTEQGDGAETSLPH